MRNETILLKLLALALVLLGSSESAPCGVISESHRDRPDPQLKERPEPKVTAPPGVLQYVAPGVPGVIYGGGLFDIEGADQFKKPALNAGTVNPNALVVTVKRDPLVLAVALDSKEADSPHFDLLRLDFSGKGDFRSAHVIERVSLSLHRRRREFSYRFAAWPLEVKIGSRRLPVRLWCDYSEQESGPGREPDRSMKISIRLCAQGACRFGDAVHTVRLHDGDGNLHVNDPARGPLPVERGDLIHVDPRKGERFYAAGGFYGHPILVDGRLWTLTVSRDGTKIAAKPYQGATGNIRINHVSWRATFVAKGSLLVLQGGRKAVPIPVGRYTMHDYEEWPSAKSTEPIDRLELFGDSFAGSHGVVVQSAAGRTEDIAIGSPLKGTLRAAQRGNTIRFGVSLRDVSGRPNPGMHGPRSTTWRPKVVFSIFDASGKLVTTLNRALGLAEWKVPPNFKGTFSASVEFPSDTFPVETESATFTLK